MMPVYGKEFADVYNVHWAFWGPHVWPFLAQQVENGRTGSRTWLDLCCGCGSLLKLICENDYDAVGLDCSAHQLRHARANAPAARLVQADVRTFSLSQRFDVISCMYDSLNYLTAKSDLLRAFRNVRRHLELGGLFAFDVNTYEGLLKNWCETTTIREPRRTVIVETSFDPKRARGRCLVTGFVQRPGGDFRRFEEEHIQRGYRPAELEALLAAARLRFRKRDGRSFGKAREGAARLIYLCRRA